ncbi:MAG: glutaminyl-peptide cyclotransferase, partial [Planctomycetota bacterium]
SKLYFRDPETFEEKRVVTVRLGRRNVGQLNELEYAGGFVYANRWNWDSIYKIDPKTGQVVAIIELSGLWTNRPEEGVMNGIAVRRLSRKTGRVIVTGKYCPYIYEIELEKM